MTSAVTPIFDPNGVIRQIPNDQVKDAIGAGGKLAVQMVKGDDVRYIPHDQVAAARVAGAEIYDKQGAGEATQPKEGFWHSLGSVFGLTSEQLQAHAQYQKEHPIKEALESTPGVGIVMKVPDMAKAAYGNLKKAGEEDKQSVESLQHGDIKGFLAHQIGIAGYTGAAAVSPVLGDSAAKAGEQLGEGNVAGGMGTATGVLAPMVMPSAVRNAPKIGESVKVISKPVAKMALDVASDIPIVRKVVSGSKPFIDVPAQLKDIWGKDRTAKIADLHQQLTDALAKITDVPDLRVQPSQQAPQNLLNKPSAPAVVPRPQGGTFQVNPPENAVTPSGRVTPDMEIYKEPDVVPKLPAKKLSLVEQLREWDNIRKIHSQLEDQIGKGQDEIQQWMADHNKQTPGGKNPAQAAFDKAKQGGHAGGGAISEEEAARPGTNYVVSKSGNVTAHGKQFAPESIPPGSTHVSVLPDGSFRVNAGQKLTALQESALQSAVKKPVFSGTPKVPASESEMESILTEMMRQMKSNKARSAKAGD